jgi:protein ImuA
MYRRIVNASMNTCLAQQPILKALQKQLRRLERAHRSLGEPVSSDCHALNQLLDGGFRRGTLIEYLADAGSGAVALALIAAKEACREGGSLVVVNSQWYPPALNNLGVNLANVIFVRPRTRKDRLWTLHQSLTCKGTGAVLCCLDRLDDKSFRGLQLAAEISGALGLFIRPAAVRGDPTWSEVQLLVETLPAVGANRRMRVELVRCRTGNVGASVELDLDDETGTLQESHIVHLASSMAVTAGALHSPGA